MAVVAKFLGLNTAGELDKTKKELDRLEARVAVVPGPSIASTHHFTVLPNFDGTSLKPVTMCVSKTQGDPPGGAPPKMDLTGQMCAPTLQYSVGEGKDFSWVHFCSESRDEVSAIAAAVGADAYRQFNEDVELPLRPAWTGLLDGLLAPDPALRLTAA
jgi:hypothetical protein